LRILILSNLCPPHYLGGFEIACLNVARALDARGHEVQLLTTPSHVPSPLDPPFVRRHFALPWFDPYELPPGGAREAALHDAACSNYRNTCTLIEVLREFVPDVVYCWNLLGLGGPALLDLLNIVGAPWVMHLMDVLPPFYNAPPHIRHVFNDGPATFARGRMICVSLHLLDEIAEVMGLRLHDCAAVIPCWVEVFSGEQRDYQNAGQTCFVTAGTISPHKGMTLIVEAAAYLVSKDVTNFSVDIFGAGAISEYVSMAKTLGVAEHVRFLGLQTQPKLLASYRNYDAFLFPTHEREPFGFAPIEALAYGCVPLITRNCGVSERLVDRVHCIKIERTTLGLADAMMAVVRGDINLHRIGRAGAALVRTDLSLDRCVNRIERVLLDAARQWDRELLNNSKLTLLTYVKHHLARSMRLGSAS
jgi:glycosyltransferase involved in cell wall biosynthesis